MNVAIRIDDIGWSADSIEPAPLKRPDVGLEIAQRLHTAMQGAPYLGAVIPTCVDADGRTWLESKPAGLTIALHGLTHERVDGVDSEFRDCSQETCRTAIALGLEVIGSTLHTVPPFNAVEQPFVEACYEAGINYVWGGGSHDTRSPSAWPTCPPPYPLGRVTFVPSWLPLYGATRWRMSGVAPLLETLPSLLEQPGKALITLHLPWEVAHSPDFDGVRELIQVLGDRIVSPQAYIGQEIEVG